MNLLLAGLNAAVRGRLQPRLEQVPLARGQTLEDAGAYGYFPTSGLVSLLAITADGGLVELATVANGGVIGLPTRLHDGLAPYQATVQIAGAALRLRKQAADAEFARDTTLSDAVFPLRNRAGHRCFERRSSATPSTKPCSGPVAGSSPPPTGSRKPPHTLIEGQTGETLAQALGVLRPAVTRVALELQDANAIRCRYGRIVIVNRALLERSSCDCYRPLRPDDSSHAPTAEPASPNRRPVPMTTPDRRPTPSPNPRPVR